MAMEEKKNNRRLIVRLGALLIRYAVPISVVCCLAGFLTLMLLPVLAKNTYISENALMPGSANPRYSEQNTKDASELTKEIMNLKIASTANHMGVQSLLFEHMSEAGGDVYFHKFLPPDKSFTPSRFFVDPQQQYKSNFEEYSKNSSVVPGVNVVGIIRAPHGDGKEAIVLVTPFLSDNICIGDAFSLGLGYSLFYLFSRTIWLAKDFVWLAADSKYGTHAAVAAWLKDYHEPIFYHTSSFLKSESLVDGLHPTEEKGPSYKQIDYNTLDDFQRAGTIAAALVFKVQENQIQTDKDSLNIYAEASNGQMPNLDLINVVNFLAVHRQGLHTRVESLFFMLSWKWLSVLGGILEWLGKIAFTLNPDWKFGLPSEEYVQGAAGLASSIYHQALGIPTGAHGSFRDYQVDAITLEVSLRFSLENEMTRVSYLLKIGRLLEGVVRSVNNLLEKFHQSFFLYFLTSSSRFISIGVYMIPFALLLVPLVILAAALCSYKIGGLKPLAKSYDGSVPRDSNESELTHTNILKSASGTRTSGQETDAINLGLSLHSQEWFNAAKDVLFVHLWAAVVAMFPSVICRFSVEASEMKLLIWAALSCLTLFVGRGILGVFYPKFDIWQEAEADKEPHIEGWVALKAFTLGITTIGLVIMSVINFAAALLGVIVLVPMCLSVYPLKYILKASIRKGTLLMLLSISFIILAFPPFLVVALRGFFDGFSKASFTDFWDSTEMLWSWGSATYPYLFLVHVPCWVLCFQVLLYI